MELGPFSLYQKAVEAVPAIRYALGVAGIIAAAMLVYNITDANPQKAVLAFAFTLAGMYLLLIFVNMVNSAEIIKGPVTAIIWAVTFLFILFLACTFSAFAWGIPEGIAELFGATPRSVRQRAQQPQTTSTTSGSSIPNKLTPTSRPEPVQETFQISDRSDDCAINRTNTVQYCLQTAENVLNWQGPVVSTYNCSSTISNVHIVPNQTNCISADVHLQGCGYDRLPFGIRNCRGRGWIVGSIVVNGEK